VNDQTHTAALLNPYSGAFKPLLMWCGLLLCKHLMPDFNMIAFVAVILFLVFLFLASMHIYWALGGRWGGEAVIPAKEDATKVFTPGPLPTLIVAAGLLVAGFLVLITARLIDVRLPRFIDRYALWFIAGVFMIRAIGDFKYVGFFKKITKTKFAQNDSRFYSPLCVVIAILTLILALYK
jgi:hypothetical protein